MGKTRLTINETSLSVKELFISFIDERQQLGRSKVTLATYQESMKDFYDVFGSDIKVSDIGKSTVLLYQKALNSRGVSVSTVNHTAIRTSLNKYNKARGVTKTSAHLLRHTFAKLYIMNGGDLVRLQRLLGHSTLEMSRHYVNLYGPDLSIGYENTSPLRNLMANSQEPKRSVIKVKRR